MNKKHRWQGRSAVVGTVLLYMLVWPVSCGVKGDPVPPRQIYPQPPSRVRTKVQPQGIQITCNVPSRNNEGKPLKDLDLLEVWRADITEKDCPNCPLEFRKMGEIAYSYPEGAEIPKGTVSYLDQRVRKGEYVYQVVAITERGIQGRPSRRVRVYWDFPPRSVQGLRIEAGEGRVELKWEAVRKRFDGVPLEEVAYQVFRARKGTGFERKPVNREPLFEAGFVDRGLKNNMTYRYKVRAIRPVGEQWVPGPLSDVVEVTPRDLTPPDPPSGLVAFPTAEGIRLVWEGGEQAGISGYRVYRSTSKGGPWISLTEKPLSTIFYEDRSVKRGQWYWYTVTAWDNAIPPNESEMSEKLKTRLP